MAEPAADLYRIHRDDPLLLPAAHRHRKAVFWPATCPGARDLLFT